MVKCTNCGHENHRGSKYCTNCGKQLFDTDLPQERVSKERSKRPIIMAITTCIVVGVIVGIGAGTWMGKQTHKQTTTATSTKQTSTSQKHKQAATSETSETTASAATSSTASADSVSSSSSSTSKQIVPPELLGKWIIHEGGTDAPEEITFTNNSISWSNGSTLGIGYVMKEGEQYTLFSDGTGMGDGVSLHDSGVLGPQLEYSGNYYDKE